MSQRGANWIRRNKVQETEEVCTQHYVSDEESVEVKPGVRKRKRNIYQRVSAIVQRELLSPQSDEFAKKLLSFNVDDSIQGGFNAEY